MELRTDFLIIGSGIAGLSFALNAAREGSVAIITKKEHTESNTNYAQGGIASVVAPNDSFDLHIRDTLNAGAGLCHSDAVTLIVREGPRMVENLMRWGVAFTKKSGGKLALGREGGHSKNRIVHAADLTGREIEHVLGENVQASERIAVYENHIAIDLITEHHLLGIQEEQREHVTCWGAYALDTKTGQVKKFLAISEAVRGYGGHLITRKGERFMERYHEMGSLAPRDIVARAIDHEMKRSGEPCVYLDVTGKDPEETKARFPNIFRKCLSLGMDLTRDPIPVVPAAHYMCGGVRTDLWGRTAIRGLYACGEVAFTGVHGANRLASNSLLEALVFSERAYRDVVEALQENRSSFPNVPEWNEEDTFNTEEWVIMAHDREEIRRLMWDYVGIVRSNFRLKRAQRRIRLISEEVEAFYRRTKVTNDLIELRNVATVAELIVRSALMRKESRGLHYTTDYPETNDRRWKRDTMLGKGGRRRRRGSGSF